MQNFFSKSVLESLSELGSRKEGLFLDEVESRYLHAQKTQIKTKKSSKTLKFLSQFSDLMVLILLISSIVSIVIGIIQKSKGEIVDGSIILGIVILNATIGFFQENKAEKSLEALRKMSEPECVVVREGNALKIPSNKLVRGDIVSFEAGSIIPADMRLIESFNLSVDEASLTGESFPVFKESNCTLNQNCHIAERKNIVFKGTCVCKGRGLGVVFATGTETELGKVAKSVDAKKKDMTPLQKKHKGYRQNFNFCHFVDGWDYFCT